MDRRRLNRIFVFRLLMFLDNGHAAGMGLIEQQFAYVPDPVAHDEGGHTRRGHHLAMSLLYFEEQLSGRLSHGQRVAWRDHFGLIDGLEEGMDLVGGYYNASDHVKFGLPMAFTVTILSWSLLEYGGNVAAIGELAHSLEYIKWGTDYFIKAHTKPDELWAEAPSLEYLLE
ncbi:Endoglucanase 7 [Hordeum vulgare]|nr:Endoglucanase 7 [Hordeum vulgare]